MRLFKWIGRCFSSACDWLLATDLQLALNSYKYDSRLQEIMLDEFITRCHKANVGWWMDLETGEWKERNKAEMLCLIHSEISECLEGVRKDLQDEHLPQFSSEAVELADALIRIFDYAGGHGVDLAAAFEAKMQYNAQRADHKHENRKLSGGKKF